MSRWWGVVPVAFLAVILITAVWSVPDIFTKVDIGGYLQAQTEQSSFIEDEYVDPESVELSFSEEKRNLIYIFLESMELTYYSSRNGGFYETDFIPELEQLPPSLLGALADLPAAEPDALGAPGDLAAPEDV